MDFHRDFRREINRSIRSHESHILSCWYDSQFEPDRLRRFHVDGADGITREAAIKEFLIPLLRLLLEYFTTGESRFRDLYLNERFMDSEKAVSRYIGRFVATDRNSPASTLFTEAGFLQYSDTEWVLDASSNWPDAPSWFNVVKAEDTHRADLKQ